MIISCEMIYWWLFQLNPGLQIMLQIGLCVPDSCSEEDAVLLFNTGKIQFILIMASVILPIFHLQYNISLIFFFSSNFELSLLLIGWLWEFSVACWQISSINAHFWWVTIEHRILCKNEYSNFSENLDFIKHWTLTAYD